MKPLLGIPDLLAMRVRIRMLLLERDQEAAREGRAAAERARVLDADEVGRRADERAAREMAEIAVTA
jgi:hypothetical protein